MPAVQTLIGIRPASTPALAPGGSSSAYRMPSGTLYFGLQDSGWYFMKLEALQDFPDDVALSDAL